MVDNRFAKAAFMVKNIMRDAKLISDGAGITNVLPRAARPCALYRASMIIKLQCDANGFRARARRERRDN